MVVGEVEAILKARDEMSAALKSASTSIGQLNTALDTSGEKAKAHGAAAGEAAKQQQNLGQMAGIASKALGMFGLSLGVGAVVAFGKALLDDADHLTKLSDKTGISVKGLQTLQFIAGQSGNNIDQLTSAVSMLQRRIAGGDDSAEGALQRLGIAQQDFMRASPDEQFLTIARAIAKVEDPAKRAKLAFDLFGRAGDEILPSLIAKVDELAAAAPDMSAKSVKALDDFGDKLSWLKGIATTQMGEVVAHVLDAGTRLVEMSQTLGRMDFRGLTDAMFDLKTDVPIVKGAVHDYTAEALAARQPTFDLAAAERDSEAALRAQEKARRDTVTAIRDHKERMEEARRKEAEWQKTMEETEGRVGNLVTLLRKDLADAFHVVNPAVEEMNRQEDAMKGTLADLLPWVDQYGNEVLDSSNTIEGQGIPATKEYKGSLDDLAQAFGLLAQTSGPLAGFAKVVGDLISTIELGVKAGGNLHDGWVQLGGDGKTAAQGALQLAAGAAAAAAAMDAAVTSTNEWTGALQGAAAGASIGAQSAGVYGAAVGAIVGAIYGAIKADENRQKAIAAARDQYLKSIPNMEEYRQKLLAAGYTTQEFNRIVYDMSKSVDAYQRGLKQLDDAVAEITKKQEAAKKAADAFKTAITLWTQPLYDARDKVAKLEQQVIDMEKDLAANPDPAKALQLDKLQQELENARGQVAGLEGDVRDRFPRMADYALGAFAAIYQSTGSFSQALQAVGPILDQLALAHDTLGLRGSAAFEELYKLRDIQKVYEDDLKALDALTLGMGALEQAGIITQGLFNDFSTDVGKLYQKMVDGGVDGKQALILMQPHLQKLWELQQKYGFEVDETTKNLLHQAEQMGIVGPDQKSWEDKLLDVMQEMSKTIREMASFMESVWAPKMEDAWDRAAGGVDAYGRAINNLPRPPGTGTTPGGWYDDGGNYHSGSGDFHTGGYVSALHAGASYWPEGTRVLSRHGGGDVPAYLQVGEYVMSRSAVNRLGTALLDRVNAGSGNAAAAGDTDALLRELRGVRADNAALRALLPRAIRDAVLFGR